jgi:NADH-quinone oxidoreductase subunit N
LVTSILGLVLYGALITTNTKYNYPLISRSFLWLSTLVLSLTLILILNNDLNFGILFNNTFIYDDLSMFSKSFILVATIFCLLISQDYFENKKLNSFEDYLLVLLAVLGLLLLVSSSDLILAYLAIELQSLSFYVLATFKRNSAYSTEAGLKYFVLGAFASGLILFGSSLIYGFTGTTNFEHLANLFLDNTQPFIQGTSALGISIAFLCVGFLFKLAAAPFHMWSPDVYEGAPTNSTALFAIVPKIAIFVLFIRLFHFSFYNLIGYWQQIILFSAVISVIIGSFVALKQRKIKRLIAYSAISHVGYLLLAFAAGSLEGNQALFFYLIIYMLTGTCVWAIVMSLEVQTKHKNLAGLSFLLKINPVLAFTFSLLLFSLAGVPPLAGFYAKMQIFLVSIESSMFLVATVAILSSVISTFYYIRIIKTIYFEKIVKWNFYIPVTQVISILMGITFMFVSLLFLNPTIFNLFAYKMAVTCF